MDVHGQVGVFALFFRFRILLCCAVFFIEFFFVPGLVAEAGVGYAATIDDNLLGSRLETCIAQVRGGGLQAIEEQRGFLVFDAARQKQAHDLHECNLNRVRIFE